jgi:MGT family glycosyltransferase
MGRIVYFSLPAYGHINPTLPVVRELSSRQHELVYFSTGRFRQSVEDTGAHFRAYAGKFDMPERGPGGFAHLSTTLETLLHLSCAVLEQHLDEVRAMQPTHIMYDSFAPWGSLVAQLLRRATIASIPSILINAGIAAQYGEGAPPESEDARLSPQWYAGFESQCRTKLSRFRLAQPPAPPQMLQSYGDLNLVYTSRAFQPAAEAFAEHRFQFVGPCFAFRPQAPRFPFEQLDGRPLVFISLGTVYGNQPQLIRTCVQELAGGPWQVVLATGGLPVAGWGPAPPDFIVREVVPQIEILQRAAVFITHGGMNSVQEALYYGVPMVMAPQGADQFWVSARTVELGAALALDAIRTRTGTIRSSVEKLIANRRFADAAAHQGRALRMAGGHARAADEVENFIRNSS